MDKLALYMYYFIILIHKRTMKAFLIHLPQKARRVVICKVASLFE